MEFFHDLGLLWLILVLLFGYLCQQEVEAHDGELRQRGVLYAVLMVLAVIPLALALIHFLAMHGQQF